MDNIRFGFAEGEDYDDMSSGQGNAYASGVNMSFQLNNDDNIGNSFGAEMQGLQDQQWLENESRQQQYGGIGFQIQDPEVSPYHTEEQKQATLAPTNMQQQTVSPQPFDNDNMNDPANFFGIQAPVAQQNPLLAVEQFNNGFQQSPSFNFSDYLNSEQQEAASIAVNSDHPSNGQIFDNQQQISPLMDAPAQPFSDNFFAEQHQQILRLQNTFAQELNEQPQQQQIANVPMQMSTAIQAAPLVQASVSVQNQLEQFQAPLQAQQAPQQVNTVTAASSVQAPRQAQQQQMNTTSTVPTPAQLHGMPQQAQARRQFQQEVNSAPAASTHAQPSRQVHQAQQQVNYAPTASTPVQPHVQIQHAQLQQAQSRRQVQHVQQQANIASTASNVQPHVQTQHAQQQVNMNSAVATPAQPRRQLQQTQQQVNMNSAVATPVQPRRQLQQAQQQANATITPSLNVQPTRQMEQPQQAQQNVNPTSTSATPAQITASAPIGNQQVPRNHTAEMSVHRLGRGHQMQQFPALQQYQAMHQHQNQQQYHSSTNLNMGVSMHTPTNGYTHIQHPPNGFMRTPQILPDPTPAQAAPTPTQAAPTQTLAAQAPKTTRRRGKKSNAAETSGTPGVMTTAAGLEFQADPHQVMAGATLRQFYQRWHHAEYPGPSSTGCPLPPEWE
ncbi:hypothetical protein G7Z17_g10477 [Cylindrodendrum hubeiense]|uniref:Uncharacterized protein n=1 Tax=Cylindrodendrum hubeiense TaxID=595255 RepID=A0A9P5H235_9HYPO|nr:hypothetical protein G7Z17_g10477 [Cylindrodendrum hubeiense]